MNSASARRNQQCPTRVFLEQSSRLRRRPIADGIALEPRHLLQFFAQRQDLAEKRIIQLPRCHSPHIAPRSKQGKAGRGAFRRIDQFRRKVKGGKQLRRVA